MAEPLSITASIIALIGAAEKTGKGLEKLRTLRKASDELEYVLNEISDMRVVLRSVQNALIALTEREAEDIGGLIQRCQAEVLELDKLVSYDLQAASGFQHDGRPKPNTLGWLSHSGKVGKIRERLRDRRETLVAALVGSLFTISHGIRLHIRDISLVDRGEPDQSLVRLDHPQAASMQHVLEELLSRDSVHPRVSLNSTNSGTYVEEEPESAFRQRRRTRNALTPNNPCLHSPSVSSTRALRVRASLPDQSCGKFCQCQCHIHTQVQIPRWMSGVLGTMFGSYRGTPTLGTRPCNYGKCKRNPTTASSFTYYFPSSLLNSALTFTSTWKDVTGAGGSWHITIPQLIPDQHSVWGSHTLSDREILDLFHTRQASPYMVRTGDGYSILFWAIHHWKIEICKYLLHQNAHRYIQNKKGSSPHELAWTRILSLASPDRAREIPRLRELFEDDDVFDNLGFTVLHMIVTGLKSDSLESILENDTFNLNILDNQNKSPLTWAAARGDCRNVGTLLEYGALTTPKDKEGRTALSWAAWSGSSGCATCVRLLLEHGADPNMRDTRAYESPLHWSLKGDQTADIVTALLDYGADMASPSVTGAHPLHRAALSGALQNATILLDRGADIDAIIKPGGETPLLTAAFWNKPLLVNLFLERRAKLTVRDDGKNLLHIAAEFCGAQVFDILLSFRLPGITAEDTDAEGKTAWDIFKQRHDTSSRQRFSSEEEYKRDCASLVRLLELGKFSQG